ncbi:MAG: hypothetical protein IPI58_05210 [Alphaproteobacteria bacterium]|nr:MAG: hypothetical protein IPI58_05210 [Alphaproteobacteria bacterium]
MVGLRDIRRYGLGVAIFVFLLIGAGVTAALAGPMAEDASEEEDTPVAAAPKQTKAGVAIPAARKGSGLPLPRFAALRSDHVNFRAGPGTRYPIAWVFKRQGLPVEIVAEFDTWRQVRDIEGATGWVQRNMLSGKRSLVVTGKERRALVAKPESGAGLEAWIEPGAVGRLEKCQPAWCRACFDGTCGWLPKTSFWGAYSKEVVE